MSVPAHEREAVLQEMRRPHDGEGHAEHGDEDPQADEDLAELAGLAHAFLQLVQVVGVAHVPPIGWPW